MTDAKNHKQPHQQHPAHGRAPELRQTDDVGSPQWRRRSTDAAQPTGMPIPRPEVAPAQPQEYRTYADEGHFVSRPRNSVYAVLEPRPSPRRTMADKVQVTATVDRIVATNFDYYVRSRGLKKQECIEQAMFEWLENRR